LDAVRERFTGGDWPVFILQAWPALPARLAGIHDRDGIKGAIQNWEPLRPRGGFNLGWLQEAEVYREGGLSFSLGDREGLRIIPAGVLTFFADGGPNLLGWGMDQHGNQPRVNPTALAELTYEFVGLVREVAVPAMSPPPEAIQYGISLLDADRPQPIMLQAGYPGMFKFEPAVPLNTDEFTVVVGLEATVPREAAVGLLLRGFYERFGLGAESIPFLGDARLFNVERFLNLAGAGA
jgi:hypothetical protein